MKLNQYTYMIRTYLSSLWKKGALYILCGSFLMKAAAFLGSIVLVRVLPKAEYGLLGYMENLYTYAYLLAGLGLNNAVFRYVVLEDTMSGKKGVIDFVSKLGTIINLILMISLCILSYYYPHSSSFSAASSLLPIMLLAIPLQFLFDTGTFSLRALFENRAYAIFAVLAAVGIWGSKALGSSVAGLTGAVYSWPITYAVMAVLVMLYLKVNVFISTTGTTPSDDQKSKMLFFSIQYMLTNGLWVMFLQNDLLLIGALSGSPIEVASYKVAYAIPAAMSILSNSIGTFVAPYFVKNESNKIWVWKNYLMVLFASVLGIGLLSLLLFILCKPVVLFLYGEQYIDSIIVMRILLIASFLSNAVRYTAANLLAAMGYVRVNLAVSALGIVLQVVLDFCLIPKLGMLGAAICSVTVYFIMSLIITVYFIKKFHTDLS